MTRRHSTTSETARDTATLNKKVHQILSRHPVTLDPDTTVQDAIDTFNTHRISCIPIVNQAGAAVGILSWRDVFRLLSK